MKTIWDDRVIGPLINELKAKMRTRKASSAKDKNLCAPRFVFVCGKSIKETGPSVRGVTIKSLNTYTKKNNYGHESHNVLCVISEELYGQDYSEDVFTFEKLLAEISQKIIIPVESVGTYCELGAFVMNNECFEKIIAINEYNTKYLHSFVTQGPIKMLSRSNSNKVIWYNGRIESNTEFIECIKEIATQNIEIPINENSNCINIRSLIYELANIIELFSPITPYEIEFIYKRIKTFDSYTLTSDRTKIRDIKTVIRFMEDMGLIINDGKNYYQLDNKYSCYNTLFLLSRKEYNNIRILYLNRLNKYQK